MASNENIGNRKREGIRYSLLLSAQCHVADEFDDSKVRTKADTCLFDSGQVAGSAFFIHQKLNRHVMH